MSFWGDYHTHTVYSHGKGTVYDNARAAAEKGLKEIAITDHGLRHAFFGLKRKKMPALRLDCTEASERTGVLVLMGIENNFNSFSGSLDARADDLEKIDIVQGGFHRAAVAQSVKEQFTFQFRNLFSGMRERSSKKLMVKNTDAYLKLIENYELDFIGHLNRDINADALTVARFAHQKGTYIELNSKRFTLTDKELEKMAEEGVEFVCNSDAHSPSRVGDMSLAESYINRLHIPYELIANWDKFPSFRSHNYKRATAKREKE